VETSSKWVKVSEIANEYGLTKTTVYNLVRDGKIEASYITKRQLRINRDSMQAHVKANAA